MDAERWRQVEQLYHQALEHSAEARAAFLDQACPHDQALRREVESLLEADEAPGHLFEIPLNDFINAALAGGPARSLQGTTIGRYQIVSPLGEGSTGQVYLARDTNLGRNVALKLLHHRLTEDSEVVQRFRQEAQAVSRLNHPNIVTVFETGREDGLYFIAAECVDGQTLQQKIETGRVEAHEAVAIAAQAAGALNAAHDAGIVHRDIKPANIMVRRDGYVKVLDFGIAKLNGDIAAQVHTKTQWVIGTPAYMSPEQILALPLDGRTDIFSLGVVLYEMLSGRRPFDGSGASEGEAQPLRKYLPEAPRELERIVAKALARDRNHRYQSARELETDLKNLELEFQAPGRRKASSGPASVYLRRRAVFGVLTAALAAGAVYGVSRYARSDHAMAVYVIDTQGRPLSGIRMSVEGTGGTVETSDGKARIPLTSDTTAKSWVKLAIAAPDNFVFISPWDGRTQVPAFEDESQNYVRVVLGERGQRRLLEEPAALRAILEQWRQQVLAPRPTASASAGERKVLADVATRFGLDADATDKAILSWGQNTQDAYEKGLANLYTRNYPAATRDLMASLRIRREKAVTEMIDATVSLAQSFYKEGKFSDAAAAYEEAHRVRPDDPHILNGWGVSLFRTRRYKEAESVYRQALAIRERTPGPNHPDTATSLHDLGVLMHFQGDDPQAESLYRRALAVREKHLGSAHPLVAESLTDLGVVLRLHGDLPGAEKLMRRALAISETVLSAGHPDIAEILNALAGVNSDQGDYAAAEPLYRKALTIREKSLGPEHPDTAISLNNLGTLLRARGEYGESERLYRRALAIKEKALGPQHGSVAIALINIGAVLTGKGDYDAAEPLFQRAIAILEKAQMTTEVAWCLNYHGELLSAKRDYVRAEPLLRRAYRMTDIAAAERKPLPSRLVAKLCNNLGVLLTAKRQYTEAEPLLRRGLELREKTLGPGHPDIGESLAGIGTYLAARGDVAEAVSHFQRALEISERALGARHPRVQSIQASLTRLPGNVPARR